MLRLPVRLSCGELEVRRAKAAPECVLESQTTARRPPKWPDSRGWPHKAAKVAQVNLVASQVSGFDPFLRHTRARTPAHPLSKGCAPSRHQKTFLREVELPASNSRLELVLCAAAAAYTNKGSYFTQVMPPPLYMRSHIICCVYTHTGFCVRAASYLFILPGNFKRGEWFYY
jgi:hypothetical protein